MKEMTMEQCEELCTVVMEIKSDLEDEYNESDKDYHDDNIYGQEFVSELMKRLKDKTLLEKIPAAVLYFMEQESDGYECEGWLLEELKRQNLLEPVIITG